MIKKIGLPLAVVLFVATLVATGYWMLFSSFAVYDDEGYILLTAREYFAHGHLYERVYSQYGPAFYAMWDMLQHIVGQPVDHTWSRLATLAFWIGTATSCALLVRRQTKSDSLSLFTLAATFLFLYFITDEPFHPGSLICFILAASLALTAKLIDRKKISAAAALAGCTGAFLLLTKINVGVFYFASVAGWGVMNVSSAHARRIIKPIVPALFIFMAAALMHTLIRETWIQIFLALFACGAVSLAITTKSEAIVTQRHAALFSAAAFIVGFAILLSIWFRGTSPAGLLEGVVLGPLRHPGNYSYPVDWRPGSMVVACLSLVLAGFHRWSCGRLSNHAADRLVIGLRIVTGTALFAGFALLINFRAVGAIFSYVAPLIWIWTLPLQCVETTYGNRAVRNLLGIVLLLQYLHAYPVGGSQESWGVFLFIPLVALGLGDVRLWLLSRSSSKTTLFFRWTTVSSLIVAVVLAKTSWTAFHARRHYLAGVPLELPGAAQLRLPELRAASYRILSLNAAVHSDLLFSLPGMFSFNVWTGLPTPTDKNTTLWFTLLSEQEQQAIIEILNRSPRAVLIVQESLLEMMQANHLPMHGTLWDYVHQHFSVAFRLDGFAFGVRSGRITAPFNVAIASDRQMARATTQMHASRLGFNLVHPETPIASIEIEQGFPDARTVQTLNGKNTLVTLTAINSAGHAMGTPIIASWPVTCLGLVHFDVQFDPSGFPFTPSNTLLRLRGLHSENLGEILIGQ